jgi:hypothetical protein
MTRAVLFSGHRVDAPDRPVPRFPAEHSPEAAHAISAVLPKNVFNGLSSASNGGDILFLEACAARAMPCHIVLPFPPDEFLRRSVTTDAPGDWGARFRRLWDTTPDARRHVLTPPKDANPYAACNALLLSLAAAIGDPVVITLWDGQEGDGPGGTADLVAQARARNWPVTVIRP